MPGALFAEKTQSDIVRSYLAPAENACVATEPNDDGRIDSPHALPVQCMRDDRGHRDRAVLDLDIHVLAAGSKRNIACARDPTLKRTTVCCGRASHNN